ncbi:MAG TPA: UvrD-helicase domain-containing protein [Verrucomicrobiota bacterium]|nr:UvrD-helicase domain-containing protein [Verrucomicrobiota bacterium]
MSNFTEQQSAAINGRGNLLVVAGAGTGKTHTLIARCLRIIADERVPLDDILLVTFTEAAAAEMRARLREELLKAHSAQPGNEHVAEQLALLDSARISTLHSFCLQLAREHFHQLGLDPQFSVLDERQTIPLQREALDEIFEHHYNGANPQSASVRQLIRDIGRGSDELIRALILKIHAYAQSLPDPAGWLDEQRSRFATVEPTEWRALFTQAVADWRDEWLPVLNGGFEMDEVPAITLCCDALDALPPAPASADAHAALQSVLEADATDENWPRGSVTKVRNLIKEFFADAEYLGALSATDEHDPLAEDWDWARETMTALVDVAREFTTAFATKKRELGGVDFADLEQCALALLRDADIAAAWRARLAHVFVDEYQDINAAQDAILTALSREGAASNRFLVGDVKQSIYRFRLANPKIFQTYQTQWSAGQQTDTSHGTALSLTENFRSREALLNFVNPLFASLMRAEAGGVAYEPLEFGAAAQRQPLAAKPGDPPVVELHLIGKADAPARGGDESPSTDDNDANGAPDLLAIEREARLVARRLREMHDAGHAVWDKKEKCFRAVSWSDMAVLLRSPNGRAEAFAMEFNKAGVPLCAARDGFFASLEVSDLLSLLTLLDNPLQDVPLAAVLRSPLVGLSPDELAELRASSESIPFWTALAALRNTARGVSGDLLAKLRAFLSQFDRWRELARQTSLSQTLETALDETHYEALLLADARGPERAANVRKLLELARQFDPYQRQGLYRFLRFVRSQMDEELDLQPASPPSGDAVKLISIHKSKGLEFPVVAVAGLGTIFNEQGLNSAVLLNEQLGLCPKIFPPDGNGSYPSLPHRLARRAERCELRGEELRLLYVALTRARDALILVGTANRKTDDLRWQKNHQTTVPTESVLKARCYLDWLLTWLPRATTDADWRDDRSGANALLTWKLLDEHAREFAELKTVQAADDIVVRREELLPADAPERLRSRLDWNYPFQPATTELAKASVTALRRRFAVEETGDAVELFRFRPRGAKSRVRGQLSAAAVGVAHHRFLQLASLERLGDAEGLRGEAGRLRDGGALSAEEFDALDFAALIRFWQSETGRGFLANREFAHREIPFTAKFTPEDFVLCGLKVPPAAGEFIVVQGVADLAVILPGEIRLLDFKTDDVTEAMIGERTREYTPQLRTYALALGRIYGRPVTRCLLHFLTRGETKDVNLPDVAGGQAEA